MVTYDIGYKNFDYRSGAHLIFRVRARNFKPVEIWVVVGTQTFKPNDTTQNLYGTDYDFWDITGIPFGQAATLFVKTPANVIITAQITIPAGITNYIWLSGYSSIDGTPPINPIPEELVILPEEPAGEDIPTPIIEPISSGLGIAALAGIILIAFLGGGK
jgi:hypothetical protein